MPRFVKKRALAFASAALVFCVIAACGNDNTESREKETIATTPPNGVPVPATFGDIVQGLDSPWSITFYQDTPLVSERDSGKILELVHDSDGHYSTRVMARLDEVDAGGEGGLLGLAVLENVLYAYFTSSNDNQIERFTIRGNPGSLSLGRAESVLNGIPKASNHNGGRIAFGPDQKLYATTGDAAKTSNSQNRSSLAGKILRMEPDGSVPDDNPFEGSLVYSYGHRNPQGIAWDSAGTLFASEFGQNTWDELNIIEAGGNYGWPIVEGIENREGLVTPVQQWSPSEASPSGIAIIGDRIFIANLRGQRLWIVPTSNPSDSREAFTSKHGRIRDAAKAPDGSLWILTNNTDGRGAPQDGDDRIIRVDVENLD